MESGRKGENNRLNESWTKNTMKGRGRNESSITNEETQNMSSITYLCECLSFVLSNMF